MSAPLSSLSKLASQPRGRTVLVGATSGPDAAMKLMRNYLAGDGVLKKAGKHNRYFVTPGKKRVEHEIANCKRIYNQAFEKKVALIMRQSKF